MSRRLPVILSAMLLASAPALAQDFTLDPTFGEVTLDAGFIPDPHEVDLAAGGDIDAALEVDISCVGYIADAPDYRLFYTPGDFPLIISALSEADTTLVINNPNGEWFCDDDSAGDFNPMVEFTDPASGQYDIWVGTYIAGDFPDATLRISEIGTGGPDVDPPPSPGPGDGGMPDVGMEPTFGEETLSAGFDPDPFIVELVAGGDIDASALGDNCWGMIATAPDHSLNYDAGGFPLYIFAEGVDGDDLTIAINGPDGTWYCDDDSAGNLNPLVEFPNPMSGRYDVWVGTFFGGTANATLGYSELGGPAGGPGGGGDGMGTMPDPALPPAFGETSLSSGFADDPRTVDLFAGGEIDASNALGGGCVGSIAEAPDYSINYDAGGFSLYLYVDSLADTTLVVNGPDGEWYCDDDSAGSFNPLVEFGTPQSGRYDIWVGTYEGGVEDATLFISEISP